MASWPSIWGTMASELPTTTFQHASGRSFTFTGSDPSEYIFRLLARQGDFYENDLLEVLHYIGFPTGSTAIDVGANLGNHSVFFAEILGLKVIAFEPEPNNYSLLKINCDLNTATGMVRPLNFALGSTSTLVALQQVHPNNSGTFKTVPSEQGEFRVEVLDEVIEPTVQVSLIKVDTEGDELAVLNGAVAVLDRCRPTIVVEAHGGQQYSSIEAFLSGHGFRCTAIQGRSDTYVFLPHLSEEEIARFTQTDSLLKLRQSRALSRSVGGLVIAHSSTSSTIQTVSKKVTEMAADYASTATRLERITQEQHQTVSKKVTEMAADYASMATRLERITQELHQTQSQFKLMQEANTKSSLDLQVWRSHYRRLHRSRPLHWGWRIRWTLTKLFRRSPPSPIASDEEISRSL